MEQNIIIKETDYIKELETGEILNNLEIDYHHITFNHYDKFRKVIHIVVGGHNGLNIYLEIPPYKAEKLFLELAEKARKLDRGI